MSKLEIFHLCRAMFWPLMVPVAILLGWQASVFLIFLYSSYANCAADIASFSAARADRHQGAT